MFIYVYIPCHNVIVDDLRLMRSDANPPGFTTITTNTYSHKEENTTQAYTSNSSHSHT